MSEWAGERPVSKSIWITYDTDEGLVPFHESVRPDSYLYVVGWNKPRRGPVVKVGVSWRPSRWRAFVRRGAAVDFIARGTLTACLHLERVALAAMEDAYYPAFHSKEDSRQHLGGNGGGWTECFQGEPWFATTHIRRELAK